MLTVYTTPEFLEPLQAVVNQEFRLSELVHICDLLTHRPAAGAYHLVVRPKQGISHPIDWRNELPPYLLPENIPYNEANFLGLIYAKLGNFERAQQLLTQNPTLLQELQCVAQLQAGYPLSVNALQTDFQPFEEYRFCHNAAILHHYASEETAFDAAKTHYFYQEAMQLAPSDEYAAFSAKHWATLALDLGDLAQAKHILKQTELLELSTEARMELKSTQVQLWMKALTVPYDPELLARLKTALWEVLQYYEAQERTEEAGLVLLDATRVAHYAESFAEALGYSNRALAIFQLADLPDLLAEAHYRRALLLYTWAKNGQPQFYRGALDSFKAAVKVFDREHAPAVFADIQQYLGIIYAEMPDEDLKRSVWAAISSSAFQESLAFYTKDKYPYEYAMVCSHYGNALTKYPPAVHSDNIEKALFYYQEALSVRRADTMPVERAVTLLNYVEACWYLNLAEVKEPDALLADMEAKVVEAKNLTEEAAIQDEVRQQAQRLAALKQTLAQEVHQSPLSTN